jgi:hypothetical protein
MRRTFLAAIAALALIRLTSQAEQPPAETGDLQKATQNPVAGLISVPIQSNTNFGIGPFQKSKRAEYSAGDSGKGEPELEHDHSLDYANRVATRTWHGEFGSIRNRGKYTGLSFGAGCTGSRWRTRLRRHDSYLLLFTGQTTKGNLGCGADVRFADCHGAGAGARKAEHGAVDCGADAAWSVDHRRAGEQHLVGCGAIGSRRREPDVIAVLHQLQPEKGLVYLDVANDHGELAGIERERLDGAGGRRSGAGVPSGIPANKRIDGVFRECYASGGRIAVGDAAANIVLVPEAAWCSGKKLRQR